MGHFLQRFHSPFRVAMWLASVGAGLVAFLVLISTASAGEMKKLKLQQGDHICIIGNTLADRMQHDGWLETYIQSRFPKYKLVFRNLGYSGDELNLRFRSRDFGSPDQWLSGSAPIPQPRRLNKNAPVRKNRFELTNTKADVVFAFFGYNESYAGPEGLSKFKEDLDRFVKHTLKQKYNGKSAPRLVLFSPIAHEKLKNRNLPDGSENNVRLEIYTNAMAEVAKANNVGFVDLFRPTKEAYAKSKKALTINGVHLNERGNKAVAEIIDGALFAGAGKPKRDANYLKKLHHAVVDRNHYWFNRYRTVDGYSTYGDRAFLRFTNGQTNYEVVQRELEVIDVMTHNRDKRIWAAAQGKNLKVDDSNTPPFIPVITNKPGPLPGGKHLFLTGEEAIKKMKPAKGMKVTLFASEKEFPQLINPVQMAFDTKGRLWVAVWPTYPHWKPKTKMNDGLLIFEDTDGDGKADKMKEFAGDLHCPTGFEFWNGGVLVAQAPDLVFLKDTDGDDKYDVKVRVLSGLDSADTHHTANSFTFDPGGALYFQEGTFHHTQVETPWGPCVRNANAGVFRYEPRSHKFDVYVNFGFANPHGHVFDRWGQDVVIDGTGAVPYHGTLFSGHTDGYRQRHGRPPTVYNRKTRPCPGLEILSSRNFPKEMQGNLLVPNVIGFLGILRYKLVDDGASIKGIEQEPILTSSDPNFRPADIEMGADGAIYFTDWQNPIIGHMQHNLRDPNRDQKHGRIYKVTYEKRPLLKPASIDGEPIEKLLDLLKEPEDRTRYRARIELGERNTSKVIAATQKWIRNLDKKDAGYEHHLTEALWLHQNHNVVNESLLKRMLSSPDFHARAAATRVLCYWRDRVEQPLKLLQKQINDRHPRVRLEAIRALSFFDNEEALAVAVEMLAHPDDKYLRYTFNQTLNTLERRLGSRVNRKNIAATLLVMLDKGRVTAERQPAILQTICRHGSPKELQAVWNKVARSGEYPVLLRWRLLGWLADAAELRQVQPKVNAADVQRLLKQSDARLLPAAVRLATAWNVKQTAGELKRIAESSKAKQKARFAAIEGLASFGDQNTLKKLTGSSRPMAIRFQAAVALAKINLDSGANAAAAALAAAKEKDDPSSVVEGFLVRKGGGKKLAAALAKRKVSVDNAKRILRAMYLAGQNDPALSSVVTKMAGLDAAPKAPTPDEIRKITALVLEQGNAARGERVFRRMDLGCMKCHSLNKSGGDIGPDLGPIGGSSPLDYIITSVLDPSQSIKEEYLTKVIVTKKGQAFNGIVVERNKNRVVLKEATGKLLKVPTADILEEVKGKSLMPEGVTQILTKGELYDLLRYLSELGKPGPYKISEASTIRTWKRLRDVPPELQKAIPNRDVLRDTILQSNPEAWESVYALVGGTLPLAELRQNPEAASARVVYLQGEVDVLQSGKLQVDVACKAPHVFWIDEEPFEKQNSATVQLAPGRHRITVRLVLGQAKSPSLRVDLRKPADSGANFEIIHGK